MAAPHTKIPDTAKANRKEAIACDFRAYKDRNRVERRFNKLKQFRRIAPDTTRPPFTSSDSRMATLVSSRCRYPS